MTNPNWLDEERRGTTVYAARKHHSRLCTWVDDKLPDEDSPVLKLVMRSRRCPIHGASGDH